MAESTLSISFAELQRAVAHFAGWDRDPTEWTPDQTTDFGDILKAGLRKFYYPPGADGRPIYEWQFLRPTATLSLVSGTQAYDLPDDFSGVVIDESVTLGSGYKRLKKIHAEQLRTLADKEAPADATPLYYAVKQKTHAPTTGLRYQMLFYPTPDSGYTATYRYAVSPDTLDATNIYPYGGAIHSETLLQAVLSEAEAKIDDDAAGAHHARYVDCLSASIRVDSEQSNAEPTI